MLKWIGFSPEIVFLGSLPLPLHGLSIQVSTTMDTQQCWLQTAYSPPQMPHLAIPYQSSPVLHAYHMLLLPTLFYFMS